MDDLSSELIHMIFEAEKKGLIQILRNPTETDTDEHGGRTRAMLMDHINSSTWLADVRIEPTAEQRQEIAGLALRRFLEELEDDPYRGEHDPVRVAVRARWEQVYRGHR